MAKAWGMQLLASLLRDGDIGLLHSVNKDKLTETESEVFDYIVDHVSQYAAVPHIDTVEDAMVCKFLTTKEPFHYYSDRVHERYLQKTINGMMIEVQECLTDKDPVKASKVMIGNIAKLTLMSHGSGIFDFRDAAIHIAKKYHEQQKITLGKGVYTGWKYLDGMMGGKEPGDVLTIIGRPASGKTFMLLNMARNAWREQEKVPMIISPEMKPIQLTQRLAACEAKKNLHGLQTATYSTKTYGKVMECLETLKGVKRPFYVIDGRIASTIEDVYLLCRQLRPDVVYYDAAYLMKHNNKRLDKWARIGASAYNLKDLANSCDIPVVGSYQFRKDVVKKSKDGKPKKVNPEDFTMEDIYGSDEISHVSSVILGMLQPESIKTVKEREVSVLKGRSGETGSFKIKWDFQFMNFDEIPQTKYADTPGAGDHDVHGPMNI